METFTPVFGVPRFMVRSAIQLYTLRDIDEPLADVLGRIGGTEFEGVEFAHRFGDEDPDAIGRALADHDLAVAAAHVGIEALETDLDATLDAYDAVGCETLVVPWLDPAHFESIDAIAATASRLNDLADTVTDRGFSVCYHNHDHELVAAGERTALCELIERTDDAVGFEVDTGWVAAGGADPAAVIEQYAPRIPLVHLTDVDLATGTSAEVGEGDVDIDGCVAAARTADVEWLVYERDDPTDPVSSLVHGSASLSQIVGQ